jgi:hypothetical protein
VLKTYIGVYFGVLAIALVVVYLFNPYDATQEGLKNFGIAATIACTAISAIMTGVVSLITMARNQDAARELEQLKANLVITQNVAADRIRGWASGNHKTMTDTLAKVATLTVNCREQEHEKVWEVARQRCLVTGERAEQLVGKTPEQAELWWEQSPDLAEDNLLQFKPGHIAKHIQRAKNRL